MQPVPGMRRGQSRNNGKITNMLGRADHGCVAISAVLLNTAMSGSILPNPRLAS
jgi:hypothetical protein